MPQICFLIASAKVAHFSETAKLLGSFFAKMRFFLLSLGFCGLFNRFSASAKSFSGFCRLLVSLHYLLCRVGRWRASDFIFVVVGACVFQLAPCADGVAVAVDTAPKAWRCEDVQVVAGRDCCGFVLGLSCCGETALQAMSQPGDAGDWMAWCRFLCRICAA